MWFVELYKIIFSDFMHYMGTIILMFVAAMAVGVAVGIFKRT